MKNASLGVFLCVVFASQASAASATIHLLHDPAMNRSQIGVLGFPTLMDGGTVTAPNVRIFSPTGAWVAENTGVAPDVEVELDPKAVASGHDPQLERAVSIALEQLQRNPPPGPKRPPYPDYQRPANGSNAAPSTR